MLTLALFLKAVFAGFVVAVPIGAVGAICVRYALQGRWGLGLLTGLGAAIADTLLAVAAIFGLSLLTNSLLDNQGPVRLIGGAFLLVLGAQMIRHRNLRRSREPKVPEAPVRRTGDVLWPICTGFALTIFNPATLLAYVGVFAGLGLLVEGHAGDEAGALIVSGVFLGSTLWWLTLTGGSTVARERMSRKLVGTINGVLGLAVVGFGIASLASFAGMML